MKQKQHVLSPSVSDKSLKPFILKDIGAGDSARYTYWRARIFYSIIFGYASFYLVRQNFSLAMPQISAQFGYSKTDLGKIISLWAITYAIGKFVNGYISDRSNARYFMTIGLVGSAVTSFFMSFGTNIYYFGAIWVVNAWFQSMGWPPLVRLLTHWFSPAELGTRWGIASASQQIGAAIIALMATEYLLPQWGWRSVFFIPSLLVIALSLLLFNRLRDTPQSVGLPSIECHKGLAKDSSDEQKLTFREILGKILGNPLLWYVCLGNMFLYIVRMGFLNWAPTFLSEFKGASLPSSGLQITGFDIAGMIGGIGAGWISDRFFSGRRGPVSVFYMVLMTLFLIYFWKIPANSPVLSGIVMTALGFLIYGPQVLAGVAATDFSSKKVAGMANGLSGTFGYIGASLSGICVGWVADHYGWNGGFIFFIISAFLSTFFFSLTWSHRAPVLEKQN
jgi:phosphoglycerate transporter family protein